MAVTFKSEFHAVFYLPRVKVCSVQFFGKQNTCVLPLTSDFTANFGTRPVPLTLGEIKSFPFFSLVEELEQKMGKCISYLENRHHFLMGNTFWTHEKRHMWVHICSVASWQRVAVKYEKITSIFEMYVFTMFLCSAYIF